MAITRSLLVGIVSSAAILLTPSQTTVAVAQLDPQEISEIAKPITVRIDGVNEGSGVIIDRYENVYTVVTNWHVVKVVGEYTVQTSDGEIHAVDYTQEFPNSTDLAIVEFTSDNDYDVATLGESETLGEGQTIHLAGYPGNGQIIGEGDRFYRFNSLSINAILPESRDGGYSVAYAGENFSGMSGSPILDSNGDLVGINGTAYLDVDGKARANYAIPIHTYLELAAVLESQPVEETDSFKDYLDDFDSANSNVFVKEKLNPVPVFTITDDKGLPLVASNDDGKKVAGVFISQTDAEEFVTKLEVKNPDLASKVKVVPVSLGEVYNVAEESNNQGKNLSFAYVPEDTAVNDAEDISSYSDREYEGGVPLFVARGGENQGYLTIKKDGNEVIPFFFELTQLEKMIQKFQEQKPELAQKITIEIHPLEGVIETLESNDDEILDKLVLVPSQESIDFLQNR